MCSLWTLPILERQVFTLLPISPYVQGYQCARAESRSNVVCMGTKQGFVASDGSGCHIVRRDALCIYMYARNAGCQKDTR